jgi:sec-independent protein translocase protein TatC
MDESKESGTQAAEANQPQPVKVVYTKETLALLQGKSEDEVKIPEAHRRHIPPETVAKMKGVKPKDLPEKYQDGMDGLEAPVLIPPVDTENALLPGRNVIRPRTLTTLSVQEALVVYFKVCLVAGLVIASPWVFWQIWSFVAAGLYPHEKRLVHVYLPFSLGLFLAGVFVCQFLVMPQAVAAMLWFNEWLGMTPDLRLNEWLSFAIWMPVIFGLSFQTPLVMLFTGKLGIADVPFYAEKRKYAYFAMCVFAAIITPSPDAITMLMLAVPMCLLYELGIILIKMQPKSEFEDQESETDELVEV